MNAPASPATVVTVCPAAVNSAASSVWSAVASAYAARSAARETLRRLHRHELGAVDGLDDGPVSHPLDRVDHGERRDDARTRSAHGVGHALEDLDRCEGARRIVNEHDIHLLGEGRETRRDRLLAGRPTGNHDRGRARGDLGMKGDRRPRVLEMRRRRDDDQFGGRRNPCEGVGEHRPRGKRRECFRNAGTEPLTAACGDDDDGDAHLGVP